MSRLSFPVLARWLALAACMPVSATQFSVSEIPAPLTHAVGLNDSGDIVGQANSSVPGNFSGAYLYQHRSGVVNALGCIGTPCSATIAGINDRGTAVGTNSNPFGGPRAATWPLSGGEELLPGVDLSTGTAIANNGDVVGGVDNGHRGNTAHLWRRADGSSIVLGNLVQCQMCMFPAESLAAAINDRGHIVGTSDWAVFTTPDPFGPFLTGVHAFLWRDGTLMDLGALGDGTHSSANALNNFDAVVGTTTVGAATTAFLYFAGRRFNLGNLGHDSTFNSAATGINDHWEIVGWSDVRLDADHSIVQRAFLISFGHMRNLTFLIDPKSPLSGRVKLTNAVAINCNGWIAANGYDVDTGKDHAYLLRPQIPARKIVDIRGGEWAVTVGHESTVSSWPKSHCNRASLEVEGSFEAARAAGRP